MHCRQRAHSVCRRLLFWLSPKNMKAFGNFSGRIFGTAMRLSETHRVSITNDSSDEDNLQEYQKRNRFSLSYVLHAYKRRCITSFFTKHETGKRWLDLTRDLKNALPMLPRPPRFFHWSSWCTTSQDPRIHSPKFESQVASRRQILLYTAPPTDILFQIPPVSLRLLSTLSLLGMFYCWMSGLLVWNMWLMGDEDRKYWANLLRLNYDASEAI